MAHSSRQSSHRAALLAGRAAVMRRAPTPGERILWEALRGGRLGVRFVRQVVLGDYISDFLCRSARLVVEVDGGYHGERGAQDARRDERLRRLGYRTLRVSEAAVVSSLEAVLVLVRGAIAEGT